MSAITADRGTLIVRLWREEHDAKLRGQITDAVAGTAVAGRGIAELVALFESALRSADPDAT